MSEAIILKLIDAGSGLFVTYLFIWLLRSTGVGLAAYLREYAAARRDGSQVLSKSLRELCDTIEVSGQLMVDVYRQSPGFNRRKVQHIETFDPNLRA